MIFYGTTFEVNKNCILRHDPSIFPTVPMSDTYDKDKDVKCVWQSDAI